jgi:hypothetical protein
MSSSHIPRLILRQLYDRFDTPVTGFDCGTKCAPHNPNGIPACCDICNAVPVAYHQEWIYLQENTDLWHEWRGDECASEPCDPQELRKDTPDTMVLLACQGPALCQRKFRAVSCRQFPFFPYITSENDFIGLAYEWEFEPTCWVISNLAAVTPAYRQEFVDVYEELFAQWPDEFESYALLSEEMREHFGDEKRRIPLLHRRGGYYLISPNSERLRKVTPEKFPQFGPYKNGA